LALRLGCSVRECQERVDSREFAEWLVFRTISPWGPERTDWLLTRLTATVINMMRAGGEPADPVKMMPWPEPSASQTVSGTDADAVFWESVTACHGG
jgi:hypothetical protein